MAMAGVSAVARWLPGLGWLRRYRRTDLRGDVLGAMTAWAIVVPESVAYAQIAGVPPQNAFYAAPVALVVYAMFGSSRNLIVGATSAASILSASTIAVVSTNPHDAIELSAALAIVAGVILVVAGLLRLGFITNFLAEPALTGFLFGMALIIVVRQAGKLVGASTGDGDFFARLYHLLAHIDMWSVATMAVGIAALLTLIALERFAPKVPASLVVLALGIVFSTVFHFDQHGIAIVGTIPSSVPTPHVPDVSWSQVGDLVAGGFGLALVVFAESYSISSEFARAHDYEVDANQEMIGMGVSNAAVGFFHGFAVSGSASRTAAVEGAGGTTQMVSLIAALLVLVTAAWLTPLFTNLPEAVLGAIVIVAVRGFLRVSVMREYWQRDRQSFAIAATALGGVLVFDLLPGLIIAVGLSLILFIAHASAPRMVELQRTPGGDFVEVGSTAGPEALDGLLVVRPDGSLFFGNADRVRHAVIDLVRASSVPPEVVCLSLRASYRFELPVLDSLSELDDDLDRYDVELWLVGVPSVSRPQLDRDPLAKRLGEQRIWHTVRGAAEHYEATRPTGSTA
jgi:high affinity sulfate transporter 1